MQAADLLAVIAPNAAQGAANGLAGGKAGAGLGLGKTPGVAAENASDATNPFAQALAALMAAPGLAQNQPAPVSGEDKTNADQTNPASAAPFAKGLQVAVAAGAQGKGLARLVDAQAAQPAGEAEPVAGEATNGAVPASTDATPTTPQVPTQPDPALTTPSAATGEARGKDRNAEADQGPHTPRGIGKGLETAPGQLKKLPTTGPQVDQAAPPETEIAQAQPDPLAANLSGASPTGDTGPETAGAAPPPASPPSSAQASDTAATPQAPAAQSLAQAPVPDSAEPPASVPAPTANVAPPAEQTAGGPPNPVEPLAPPPALVEAAAEAAPPSALAGGQVTPNSSAAPTSAPRATGKALGKTSDRNQDSAPEGATHASRGLGIGLETAPGQLKKVESDQPQGEPAIPDTQLAQSQPSDTPADTNVSPFAGQVRDIAAAQTHAVNEKAAAHTVAHLAEQIVSNAEGRSTRFDVQLDPAGLGKVDVKIEINRSGEMNAVMTFDNPQSAAELRSRAGELRNALEQSGFDLSRGGLSFEFAGQNGGRNPWDQQAEPTVPGWAHASFTDLSAVADAPGLARHRTIDAGGVDVTI